MRRSIPKHELAAAKAAAAKYSKNVNPYMIVAVLKAAADARELSEPNLGETREKQS